MTDLEAADFIADLVSYQHPTSTPNNGHRRNDHD